MMVMIVSIPGELPDLNTYINKQRANRFYGNKIKQEATELVEWYCKGKSKITKYPINITFNWYCKSKRKDKDNIRFGAKFILDGMQKAGIIRNDGWSEIGSLVDNYYVDKKNPRIEVEISNQTNVFNN